jgi:hypothetical protein
VTTLAKKFKAAGAVLVWEKEEEDEWARKSI